MDIEYIEYDIEEDATALATFYELGGGGTPKIVIGDEVISGFNVALIEQALAQKQ